MERDSLNFDAIVSDLCRKKSVSSDRSEFLRQLCHEILRLAGCKFRLGGPTPVERLRVLFGMDLSFTKTAPVEAHSTKKENDWEIEITSEQTYSDGLQQWLTPRGRFSLAHEIAHFILDSVQEKCPRIIDASHLSEKNTEQLCDFISSELLLPSYVFANTSLKDVIRIVKGKPDSRDKPFLLSISMLETIRKSVAVSRIALIRKLDHTPLLDEARSGIIVSMFGVNKNTGRSPSLRVYTASVPHWGFIPSNTRLSTIGLDSAVDAFNSLAYGETDKWKGKIRVNEKLGRSADRKWGSHTIDSWGEHVLYPVKGQHNYLVTTFKWPGDSSTSDMYIT